jgi:hypothetical protein
VCERERERLGFVLAKQEFYYLSHISSPFVLVILDMGSLKLFAQADFKLPNLSLPIARITGMSHQQAPSKNCLS